MKIIQLFSLGLLIVLCIACNPQSESTSNTDTSTVDTAEADKTAITSIIKAYEKGINDADLDGMIEMYASDAKLLPDGGATRSGMEDIKSWYEPLVSSGVNLVLNIQEVAVNGNWAFAHTLNDGTSTNEETGEVTKFGSRSLFILEKTDGNWQTIRYVFNRLDSD